MAAASISVCAASCKRVLRQGLIGVALCLTGGKALAFPPKDWVSEAQAPSQVIITRDSIEIDAPQGLTLWYRKKLNAPVRIRFEAKMIANGGPHDTTSDLNAFWMARETDGASPIGKRGGRFEDYDTLQTYYVGIGGNRNSTTRLRRYIGVAGQRPLLPQHDRKDALLVPNQWTQITLVAQGGHVAVERDGANLFTLEDAAPYPSGWFALRTTSSHLTIRHFRITPITAQP
jgi:hypothetical protein